MRRADPEHLRGRGRDPGAGHRATPAGLRHFLAIPVPEDTADALERLQSTLPFGRATPAENLHLTLVFLGDVDGAALEDLHLMLEGLRAPAPEIRVTGFGTFDTRDQGLLVAEIAPEPALMQLQSRVESLCRQAGFDLPRRRFRPHVTLMRGRGRLRPDQADRLAGWMAAHARPGIPAFEAEAVTLYASHLSPAGAVHEPLADYPLG